MNKKTDLFKKAIADAGTEGAVVENIVLVNQKQFQGIKKDPRLKKAHTYLRESEYKKFLSLIGRESFSDMTRELILLFMGEPTENLKNRAHILKHIKSKNEL